jgi:ABC-2 type transport system ATP-binding protein
MLKQGKIVAMDTTDHLLSAFAERVLKIKAEVPLPQPVAAQARKSEGAWHTFALHDTSEVESRLAWLREAGVGVAAIEVSEPDLEDVFVKLMRK